MNDPTLVTRIRTTMLLGMSALAVIGSAAQAATIAVGNHFLLPNTAGQSIEIQVTGGENITGVDLFVQLGDGGPELVNVGLPPGTDGPEIDSVDLETGTIFSGTAAQQIDANRFGVVQVFFSSIALSDPPPAPQSVPATGKLVTLLIDTTGFATETFDLWLEGVMPAVDGGPFDTTLIGMGGAAIAASITNGTVTIIEPSSGDYNDDGVVDAADYVVWRRNLNETGTPGSVTGDGTTTGNLLGFPDGLVDQWDYHFWRSQFGTVTMLGSASSLANVAEPAAICCTISALSSMYLLRRRTRISSRRPIIDHPRQEYRR